MAQRTWLITGVSSGFGRQFTEQLLERGDRVIGTVRDLGKVADVREHYPETYSAEVLDVTDTVAIHELVERSFAKLGRIDVIISNAGYGLFGAAEELSDQQVEHIVATNLLGPIQLIRAALPHLRAQGGGRIIQISSYGGQVAFAGNSLYHATKWGIEGFVESVAQEVAPFGIGMTIVEPGGARTEFRYGSAQVSQLLPVYDQTPAHSFLSMLDLCWSPDGRFILSGSSEATLTLWDVAARTPVQVLRGHRQRAGAVAWNRADNRVASGSSDQTVRIWDVQTGACTQILQGHTANVSSVDWSADGRLLASGGYDASVRIWDVQEGTSRVGHEKAGVVDAVVWSPDGTRVASASVDGLVLIFRATDGDLVGRFEHGGRRVSTLAWSPNGEQLVSGVKDEEKGVFYLWDVQQGALVRTFEGHSGLWGIDWSGGQDLLVSAGADGTVRWWNPQQGAHLATVQAHEAWARSVRVSPDGKIVASCGEDGVIQLWDMQSHQHLTTLRADRPYERLDISGTLGLTNAQQAALRALGALGVENATLP